MTPHADIRARLTAAPKAPWIVADRSDLAAILEENDRLRAALEGLIAALTMRDQPRLPGQQGREIQAAIKEARAALDGSSDG